MKLHKIQFRREGGISFIDRAATGIFWFGLVVVAGENDEAGWK
jgi:hypothetical protein